MYKAVSAFSALCMAASSSPLVVTLAVNQSFLKNHISVAEGNPGQSDQWISIPAI
jgi:hypothetical protein